MGSDTFTHRFAAILAIAVTATLSGAAQTATYDAIIRGGTILDGSGNPRYDADIAIKNGFIVAIGNVTGSATDEINARGMFVAPGFINIHSHASPDALPTAVNMLTQGVTTEIFNADGSGAVDIAAQLQRVSTPGLAVNLGGYIGFNSVWQTVVGAADRRPSAEEIERMRGMIAAGLDQGAWGVSAGLDYKPGYFAQTEEVIRIVDVAKNARTNFTNHDRVIPETGFSSRAGIDETLAIGEKSGLVPVVTHMKVTGREKGTAATVIASLAEATKRGRYTAADAYPYLAGQTGVGALIIPAWAVDGGRPEMLKRFADPVLRARIITEAEEAIAGRFGGPQSIYLPRTQQELTAVMKEMNAGAGETILRILEQGPDPGAIIHFGAEEDLIKILQHPATSMACDCGATTATRVHPRFYGSFPRVLGRYVREQKILSWEQAIRKSSWLPASTIGMSDRGLIAVGMAADVVVFDPNTIIDHATYEDPALPSEGVKHVFVNGKLALEDGAATGARSGRALFRSPHMPSRATHIDLRSMKIDSTSRSHAIRIDLTQGAGVRDAKGTLIVDGVTYRPGFLQVTRDWATVSGVDDAGHAILLTLDLDKRTNLGTTIVAIIDGREAWRTQHPPGSSSIRGL
ncbi:MAG: amidohydrolase family protein [Cyanobacteria bacterium]|nr:amidohydrolase family protein [Cyanobacteriota bacterium]